MANLPTYVLGAIGEHQTLSRLLLLGYNATITNLSVENTESTDILCRDSKGRFCAIQVKTTSEENWKTGISNKEFYEDKGQIDFAKGRKILENKVVGHGSSFKSVARLLSRPSSSSFYRALR